MYTQIWSSSRQSYNKGGKTQIGHWTNRKWCSRTLCVFSEHVIRTPVVGLNRLETQLLPKSLINVPKTRVLPVLIFCTCVNFQFLGMGWKLKTTWRRLVTSNVSLHPQWSVRIEVIFGMLWCVIWVWSLNELRSTTNILKWVAKHQMSWISFQILPLIKLYRILTSIYLQRYPASRVTRYVNNWGVTPLVNVCVKTLYFWSYSE